MVPPLGFLAVAGAGWILGTLIRNARRRELGITAEEYAREMQAFREKYQPSPASGARGTGKPYVTQYPQPPPVPDIDKILDNLCTILKRYDPRSPTVYREAWDEMIGRIPTYEQDRALQLLQRRCPGAYVMLARLQEAAPPPYQPGPLPRVREFYPPVATPVVVPGQTQTRILEQTRGMIPMTPTQAVPISPAPQQAPTELQPSGAQGMTPTGGAARRRLPLDVTSLPAGGMPVGMALTGGMHQIGDSRMRFSSMSSPFRMAHAGLGQVSIGPSLMPRQFPRPDIDLAEEPAPAPAPPPAAPPAPIPPPAAAPAPAMAVSDVVAHFPPPAPAAPAPPGVPVAPEVAAAPGGAMAPVGAEVGIEAAPGGPAEPGLVVAMIPGAYGVPMTSPYTQFGFRTAPALLHEEDDPPPAPTFTSRLPALGGLGLLVLVGVGATGALS